jgi:hypothetical protein
MAALSAIGALKRFFKDDPRPLSMNELKSLSAEERADMGARAAREMGMELGQEVAE